MKNFWNERYSKEAYAYGIIPNQFFKNEIKALPPGKLLLPAEGEGRNAVFAASIGWDVTAFDFSESALQKAEKLAKEKGVKINYFLSDFEKAQFENEYFDCISLTFVHPPADKRQFFHKALIKHLKNGGKIILEGFSKKQINRSSGGPKNIEMLFSTEEIINDFSELMSHKITEEDVILKEGLFHNGLASVIRFTGQK